MALPAEKARYTFADCLTREENERIEIISGNGGILQLHEVYDRAGVAKVNVLNGCFVELSKVFPEEVDADTDTDGAG